MYFKYINHHVLISDCYLLDLYSFIFKGLFFFSYFIFIYILKFYSNLLSKNLNKEFFFFLMVSTLFLCFSISSFNFIFSFISLEGLTLTTIIIVGILGSNFFVLESLLNYFFISAFSSIFFILGISIIFLYSLPLNFDDFRTSFDTKLQLLNYNVTYSYYLLIFGIFLILLFFLIKIGLFPFFF